MENQSLLSCSHAVKPAGAVLLHRAPRCGAAPEKGTKPLSPIRIRRCGGYLPSLGGRALTLPRSRPVVLSHTALLEQQAGFRRSLEQQRQHSFVVVAPHPADRDGAVKPLKHWISCYVKVTHIHTSLTFVFPIINVSGSADLWRRNIGELFFWNMTEHECGVMGSQ